MAKKILICTNYRANPNNPSCAARGSKQVISAFNLALKQKNLSITIEESPCLGFCDIGPNMRLVPNGAFFHGVAEGEFHLITKETKKFLEN